jgi:Ca2+-binding RTX toxin-like protein
MVKQYQLRVHARDVNVNLSPVPGGTDIGNHTGYDLITIHEDGSQTIQYIDLYTNISLDIGFYISAPVPAQEYTITDEDGNSKTILWGTQTAHDGTMQATTVEYLAEYKVYTSTIIDEANSTEAFKAFNKIKLEATFLQSLKDELVYNPKTRNCNTSTNYFAQQYLNGRNVFAGLPYGIYMGYSDPFYDPNSTSTTDVTIKAVRNIIDKYYSLVGTNVDLSNVNYGVVNQSDAWYAKFTTDDYNYVFAGNGEANIVDIYGDSFIYADAGNHTINAGNGNDVIYGREANVIDGGDGNDIIYAGDQTYAAHSIGAGAGDDYIYAGHGGDDVRGGSGNNTVYLGSGSDKYTGGDDIDIVDGGSKDFIFTDSTDSSFEYTLSADLSEDINEIHLGGGNDQYTGGIGVDKVWSGSGNDEISTGVGNDIVYTNDSSDKNDNNKIYLGAGSDEFYGGDGIDIVNGGSEDAETDENTIKLGGGNDEYYGGSGVDKVWAGSGDDIINTKAGNDEVYTTDGSSNDKNTVDLGAGSDYFEGGNGKDFVYGGYDDASDDVNTANLGGGEDRYYGSIGKDIVHGGADDDHIWGEDGNNELYGDAGNDHLYGGTDNDKLYGGTGRDYFYPEKGTNRIDCGTDNNTDVVMINNDASGVDTIYNVSARDIISCTGGFDLETLQQVGNDVIIYGYGGNKVIFKNVKLPEEDEPENPDSNIPAENMPVLYQPDGSVLQWDGSEYVDSGTKFPPYDEKPEDPEDLPDIPTPEPGEGDNPPLPPVIPEKPEEPEGGTEKPQTDNPPSIPEDTKGNIGKLWEDAENSRSPLVVDLDGDGNIETVSTDGNVHFDFDSNQKIENSGWIGKNEGFLVRDLNGNGQIDNGTEMFGNHTVLQNGKNAVNGFEALKDLDFNGNGKFDAEDEAWSQVKVWRDANTNGIVDSGELLTLEQAGIESINLKYDYQKEADENGNLEIQQGTFNRTDGTTGKVSDIWFDVDGTNTILNEDDITIPDDIKNLPDIKGWGNVYSLHAAMALDETGTLKSLVEQYLAATDDNTKDTLLNDIIYHWTGVQDMDPVGRNPSQVYGNVLGDARKLEALEEFMGEDYLGTWCWGERESNPHGQAAPMILQAFELLKNYVGTILSADLANNPYLQKIILTYNAETKHWDVNVDQAVALLQEAFETDATNGKIEMLQLSNILRYYDNAEDVIAAFQAKGAADGTFFETELLNFGHNSVGSAANDNLFGTEGNDLMNGLAGNDIIKAAEGDDTVLGGVGNDYIYGEDGDDVLDGEEGNDYLFGGNGNDTLKGGAGDDVLSGGNGADVYLFEKGFGNDSIDNTQDDTAPNADIIKFGEGILPENAILQRQGFDLIISVSYGDGTTDSVRVFSYFDKQGTSSTTVSAIQFADGTSWDYEYVLDHWNSLPDINGGVTLEGNNDNNTINGTSANDILGGNGGDDTIYGNAGNDFIYGGTGNDRLEGGAGNDTYLWHLGDGLDTIYDNANQDTIQFGEGIVWDYLTFRNSGNDLVILVHGQEDQGIIIQNFFSGQDYKIEKINFFDGSSVNLSEIGLTLKQLKTGESIKGTEFDDIIYANGGNDTVNAGIGDDTIYGEAGFDTLYGEDGNDTLIGGTGNDRLEGGLGDDTYIYNVGDGLDTIYDDNRGNTDNDTIKFGEGISFSDITFSRKDNNLIMTLFNDITQGVIIQNFFNSSHYQVEKLEFADGTTVPLTERGFELVQNDRADNVSGTDYDDTIYGKGGNDTIYGGSGNDTLIGGKGNDRLEGSYGDDTYIWNLGDGFDTIYDYNGGNTDNDTIKFGEGISFEDLSFERDGNSLIIYVNNDRTQGIKIQDHYSSYSQVEKLEFADGTIVETSSVSIVEPEEPSENAGQTISGTNDDDILTGSDGDDTINAGDGYNDITGGKGNDIISAGYDRDTFYYNLGDGYDKITDLGGRDQIIFGDGISKENISFYRKNDNLIISINDDFSQGIEIIDFFRNNDNRIENIKFADNSTLRLTTGLTLKTNELDGAITGTVEDDTLIGNIGENNLNGSSGDDILNGGKGNDTLDGDVGNDTYIWNLGDDIDTIRDTAGLNTIKFGENISFDDLTFKQDGNNLRLIVKNDISQGIIIQDHFSSNNINNNYHPITIFEFSDGSKFDFRENNITLTYDNRAETITGNIGDNIIDAQGGDDTITTYGGDDIINGGAGDDEISSGNGNDIITGGSGNDIINGEAGNDTYIWNLGDGMDTITDSSGFDKIKFGEGITSANLSFFKQGNNLLIFINDNHQEGIIINRYFEGSYNIELLEFTDGSSINLSQSALDIELGDTGESIDGTIYNDTITGGDGNDTINGGNGDDTLSGGIGEDTISGGDGADIISGGAGDDTIDGGAGNDTYIWNLGDGMDTITDSQGTDKIVFGEGISYDDLSFSQTNSDLYINVQNMPNQGLLIKNYFASGNNNRIETLEFSNGNLFNLSKNALILKGDGTINGTIYDDSITGNNNNDTITAGDGNDIIYGNAGNDNIDGGNGDDIIYGGRGYDTLKGGYGNDTYVWNLGDDLDTIEDDAGQNTLLFGNGISFKDLGFNMVGNNLLITVNGDKNQGVQINNFLNENDLYKIEYLKFSDGTSIYLPDLGLNMAYGATDDTINGTYNDDTIIAGNGNDTVNAGDGDDSIYGGKGNDTLNGGNGRDSYYYNLGDGYDTIAETRGNDKIIFGEGISINNLSFRQNGSNLDILINNDVSQGVTVKDFYSGTNYQVETLQFADGSTFNLSTQEITLQQTDADDTVKGTSYNDVIYGNGGHDTINAGEGNDTIVGGIGNDILNGGNGDDTYVYNLGDGFDTITDTGGDDKIVFGEGISQSDLSFEKIGNNLKISINGDEIKGIQINDHFRYDSSKVETIEFHDGSTLDISNADQLIQAMNSFSISNSASTDTLSNPTQDVSDMYSLAVSQELTRKAI